MPRRPDHPSLSPTLLPGPLLFLGPGALLVLVIFFGPDDLTSSGQWPSGLLILLPCALAGWLSYRLIWSKLAARSAPVVVTPLRTVAVALAGGAASALLSAQLLQMQEIAAAGLTTLALAISSACCGMALPATWLVLREASPSPQVSFHHDPWAAQLLLALLATLFTTFAALAWPLEATLASSPWSLPRLLPVLTMAATAIGAAGALAPPQSRAWDLRRLAAGEIAIVLLLGVASAILINALVSEWDVVPPLSAVGIPTVTHPAWLFPVLLLGITLFCGAAALHFLRRPGAATLTAMSALGTSAIFFFFFSRYLPEGAAPAVGAFFSLIPAGTLDLMSFFSIRTADSLPTIRLALLSAVTTTVIALFWLLDAAVGYPLLVGADLALGVALAVPLALGCGLAGATLGRALNLASATIEPPSPAWAPWPLLALLVLIPALLLFLLTTGMFAAPPLT